MNNHILSDFERKCHIHMNSNGIYLEESIRFDGKLHRFSADSNKTKKDEWYVAKIWTFQEKDYLALYYGSWSHVDAQFHYKSWDENKYASLSDGEKECWQRNLKEMGHLSEQERLRRQDQASIEANKIWNKASNIPNSAQHEAYLKLKGVKAHNIRFGKDQHGHDAVIIPLRNIRGEIRSLQFISMKQSESFKFFLPGGEKKGCYFEIGNLEEFDLFYVSEGYATGSSIYQASERPTIIAFDCGNLEPVVVSLKTKYPHKQIIIAGDDDVEKEKNSGRTIAESIAKKYGCIAIFPQFSNGFNLPNGKKPTDFNDLMMFRGIEELRKQLAEHVLKSSSNDFSKKIAEGLIKKQHPTEKFSPSALPACISHYILEMGQLSSFDPIMTTSALIGVISGYFKTYHLLPDTEYFQNLYPNVWMLNILESGGFKSTALNLGGALAQKKHVQIVKKVKEMEKSSLKKEGGLDPKDKRIDKEYAEIFQEDVVLPNLTTGPGLLEDLSRGRSGTIFHHEFSTWLSNLEKTFNEGLKSLFTALYDVPESFDQKTKSDGTLRLEKPFISICGASTIDWIKEQIKQSDIDSGFFARFLLFLPVPANTIPSALPIKKDRSALLAAQNKIEAVLTDASTQSRVYKLTEETRVLFEKVHGDLYENFKNFPEQTQGILNPYLKRWSPCILKLAMIFQPFFELDKGALQQSNYVIWPESILAALSIVEQAVKSTVYLFDTELGESKIERDCRKVLQYIAKCGGSLLRQKLLSSKILPGGRPSYDSALEMLEETSRIEKKSHSQKKNEAYILTNSD